MREVSAQAVRVFVDRALELELPLDRLVEGAALRPADLLAGGRLDWDAFVVLHDNAGRELEARGSSLEAFGEGFVRVPSSLVVRRFASGIASPRDVFVLGMSTFIPALFAHVRYSTRDLPGNRLRLELTVPPEHRDSRSVFRVMVGSSRRMSCLCGLPPAEVESTLEPHRVVAVIHLPRDRSLFARPRRFVRRVLGARRAADDLAAQRVEMEKGIEALERSRRDFREVLDRIPTCVGVHRDGRFVWVNRALAEALGVTPEALVGTSLLAYVHPGERRSVAARLAVPVDATPSVQETRMVRADGSVLIVEVSATREIEFDGGRARIVFGTDVTERRRYQEQILLSDRLTSLGMLAAGVAHEINNPLTYVGAQVELAHRALARDAAGAGVEAARESLDIAREGLARVRAIVSDLRTFSRASDDATAVADVHDVLRSTLALARREIDRRASLVDEVERVPTVRGSAARLGQVFLNVVLNAVEAIPEDDDPTRHVIRIRVGLDADGFVRVEIGDSGAGIPSEIAARIFDPFYTTKPLGQGTGLGLSVCHTLLSRLGGEIRLVEHEPLAALEGKHPIRTTFRVRVPVADGFDDAAEPAPRREVSAAEAGRGRVLVVDDEPNVRSVLAAMLEGAHDVVLAENGRRALEVLAEDDRFDAIVCDLMMQDLDGIDVHEGLARTRPDLAARVVFVTGGAFTARARAFLETVANTCLEKPIDVDDLLATIARVAKGGRPASEAPAAQ